MSPNRRIFLNIIATYGRSLYALVIGLFCERWTLMALGESCGKVFLYHDPIVFLLEVQKQVIVYVRQQGRQFWFRTNDLWES